MPLFGSLEIGEEFLSDDRHWRKVYKHTCDGVTANAITADPNRPFETAFFEDIKFVRPPTEGRVIATIDRSTKKQNRS